ncbi:DUF1844 domain-containing protein [uncultured Desulfovibrio sp.]|uniref:DUF1844 domain-containing protein n=1 Tax=Candidatus Desulfovibrio intestinavium TaxID=2838534 RepID=A0A9D2KRK3_9BACT|nr:DUF1844 domain-containing protein [uncultured Desulfovibrio sp.]HJA79664.1 DUF1844 domain-containing protein [Candidatus Desulfovibrio intestinavium]
MSQNNDSSARTALPEVTFSTFVMSLASAALVQLGEVPNPETGAQAVHPHLARHSIDMLEMLHRKTTQGLDEQERKLLESLLYELRMKYVMKCGSAPGQGA